MADDQSQGKPDAAEVAQNLEEKGKTLGERAKTAGDRLDKWFDKQPKTPQEEKLGQTPKVEEKQPEPVPSSKETKIEEPKDESVPEGADFKIPDEVTERTKREFEKLKETNKRLAKQVEETESKYTSVFDSFRPTAQTVPPVPAVIPPQVQADYSFIAPQQVNTIVNKFVDKDGNVDINGLNSALTEANVASRNAIAEARKAQEKLARFEETQQTREAHAKWPQLDPLNKDRFDPKFFDFVRRVVLNDNFISKKNRTLLEIADEVADSYKFPESIPDPSKIKEEAIKEYKETVANRKQGPIESGKGEERETQIKDEALSKRTRSGDPFALEERLKKLGIL